MNIDASDVRALASTVIQHAVNDAVNGSGIEQYDAMQFLTASHGSWYESFSIWREVAGVEPVYARKRLGELVAQRREEADKRLEMAIQRASLRAPRYSPLP